MHKRNTDTCAYHTPNITDEDIRDCLAYASILADEEADVVA